MSSVEIVEIVESVIETVAVSVRVEFVEEFDKEMRSVLCSDEEVWSYLTSVENQEDGSGEKLKEVLMRVGMSGASDVSLLANMPREKEQVLSCLKSLPGKKLKSILGERSVTKKAPFCPICRDAGKSAEEYTSHHIWKDESREEVICPTLLSHSCERCGEKGHMRRYCPGVKPRRRIASKLSLEEDEELKEEEVKEEVKEKAKHCKVCYQAGFGVEVYSSHYTKVDEVIMCPTILNNKCHRCGGTGHTPKYCKVTVRAALREEREVPRREVPRREVPRREVPRREDLSVYKNGLNEVSIYLENAKRAETRDEMGMWMDRALRLQHEMMNGLFPVRR